MKTKVIVIGQKSECGPKNSIEFNRLLNTVDNDSVNSIIKTDDNPNLYNYIELVCLNYHQGKDLMFAYNDPENRSSGMLYIGKFNGGVVE